MEQMRCPVCKHRVEADELSECVTCGLTYCGLAKNNCKPRCACDMLAEVITCHVQGKPFRCGVA